MRKTEITRCTTPAAVPRVRLRHRIGVALTASLILHSMLLAWITPLPPPAADITLRVRLVEEPQPDNPPARVPHTTQPPARTPARGKTAPPHLPLAEIARDILRADAERQRRQQQERITSTLQPSVMFDNLHDERYTPVEPTPPPTGLSAYTTTTGLLVYRRVGRDGKISCMYLRPPNPGNEYDHGAIYLWSLDFDRKHARSSGC
jgi:hypothetical protein